MTDPNTGKKPTLQLPVPPNCPPAGRLGSLSARYESGGRGAAAIGFDRTGGWSYGKYQIATKTGTMRSFLVYLDKRSPRIAKKLLDAGGYKAALAGEQQFKIAWIDAAKDPAFDVIQHHYIRDTHFRPLAASLKADLGLDVGLRSAALQDVVWSTSVQHGAGTRLIHNALKGKRIESLSDDEIIDLIYEERGKEITTCDGHSVLKYFPSSSLAVQGGIKKRYQQERQCAKQMLGNDTFKERKAGDATKEAGDAPLLPESLWI